MIERSFLFAGNMAECFGGLIVESVVGGSVKQRSRQRNFSIAFALNHQVSLHESPSEKHQKTTAKPFVRC